MDYGVPSLGEGTIIAFRRFLLGFYLVTHIVLKQMLLPKQVDERVM
jgi:hypothetical protein